MLQVIECGAFWKLQGAGVLLGGDHLLTRKPFPTFSLCLAEARADSRRECCDGGLGCPIDRQSEVRCVPAVSWQRQASCSSLLSERPHAKTSLLGVTHFAE